MLFLLYRIIFYAYSFFMLDSTIINRIILNLIHDNIFWIWNSYYSIWTRSPKIIILNALVKWKDNYRLLVKSHDWMIDI